MQLGRRTGSSEIPSPAATIDVLSNGHSLEKLIALKHLRKHIPLLEPAIALPVDFVEALPTIFGLTLLGPLSNRSVASQVLTLLSARDSECAAVASQFSFPSASAGLPSPSRSTVGTKTGDEEIQQDTEPEDEHVMMYDSDLKYMYSDDEDEDNTIEDYAEEHSGDSSNNTIGVTTTTANSPSKRHCSAQRSVSATTQ
ncbi:hypothetical protein Gpo141_00013923 [Globisporangium polare]